MTPICFCYFSCNSALGLQSFRPAFHVRVSVHVSVSRKVILVHLSVIVSMNALPLTATLPAHGNAALWATFPCACCPFWCNMHAHDLELVKTVKMPSDDQANFAILQMPFRVHGNTFCLLRKRVLKCTSGNTYVESWPKAYQQVHHIMMSNWSWSLPSN